VERVPQERIVLERSPHYFDAKAAPIERLVFRIIPDDAVRLANLRSGDVDVMHLVPPTDVKAILQDANLQVSEVPGPGYSGININIGNKTGRANPQQNLGTPLATSAKVREAFELSIDRAALNQVVFDVPEPLTIVCTVRCRLGVGERRLAGESRSSPRSDPR
jgi:peptide/nickel transport system substrate-binding protein